MLAAEFVGSYSMLAKCQSATGYSGTSTASHSWQSGAGEEPLGADTTAVKKPRPISRGCTLEIQRCFPPPLLPERSGLVCLLLDFCKVVCFTPPVFTVPVPTLRLPGSGSILTPPMLTGTPLPAPLPVRAPTPKHCFFPSAGQ
jgi:hypothetical protein